MTATSMAAAQRRAYTEYRRAQVAQMNGAVSAQALALDRLLSSALDQPAVCARTAFAHTVQPIWDPGLLAVPRSEPTRQFWHTDTSFRRSVEKHWRQEEDRVRNLHARYEAQVQLSISCNALFHELLVLEDRVHRGVSSATDVERHAHIVLWERPLPNLSAAPAVTYLAAERRLIVDIDMPGDAMLPAAASYTYVARSDEIRPKDLSRRDARALYRSALAQLTLRAGVELLRTLPGVADVVVNGWLEGLDGATGRSRRSCVASVAIEREPLGQVDLRRVDPVDCLVSHFRGRLADDPLAGGSVAPIQIAPAGGSATPAEPGAVDLLAYDPFDFESLITDLFRAMGVTDATTTQRSSDGGIDIRGTFQHRDLGHFKVVVQVKRYSHTVSVETVRALHGVLMHEGVPKAYLVTTSGFGPQALAFSQDKPIELIDGRRLLGMLREHLGLRVHLGGAT
jgi:restriction system protein